MDNSKVIKAHTQEASSRSTARKAVKRVLSRSELVESGSDAGGHNGLLQLEPSSPGLPPAEARSAKKLRQREAEAEEGDESSAKIVLPQAAGWQVPWLTRLTNGGCHAPPSHTEVVVEDDLKVCSVSFNADATRIAVAQSGVVRVLDTCTRRVRQELHDWGWAAAFSPADPGMLAGTRYRDAPTQSGPDAGTQVPCDVVLREVGSGEERSLEGHSRAIIAVAWSPAGDVLATGSADKSARLWAASTGECMAVLEGHMQGVSCLAWSTDGAVLATGSEDGTVRLWRRAAAAAGSGDEVHQGWEQAARPLQGFGGRENALAWVDEHHLAMVGAVGGLQVWRALEHEAVAGVPRVLRGGHNMHITCLTMAPADASAAVRSPSFMLVTGAKDNSVCIWDTRTWECVDTLAVSGAPGWPGWLGGRSHEIVCCLSVSPDGVIAAGGDTLPHHRRSPTPHPHHRMLRMWAP